MGRQGEGRKGRRREGEWTTGRGWCSWMAEKPDQGSDSCSEAQKEGPFQSNVTIKTGTLGWWLRISLHPTYVGNRGMGKAEQKYMMPGCKPRGRQHCGWTTRLETKRLHRDEWASSFKAPFHQGVSPPSSPGPSPQPHSGHRKKSLPLLTSNVKTWLEGFTLSERGLQPWEPALKEADSEHTQAREDVGGSWTNSCIPLWTKDGLRGETTPVIMEQAELGLEEALLSNDNRNKFFHHSGSGKGSDILGGKKIIPSVNLPNSPVRGQRSHGISARRMLPAQCGKESAHILSKPHSSTEKTKRAPYMLAAIGCPSAKASLIWQWVFYWKCKRGLILPLCQRHSGRQMLEIT